MTNLSGLVLWPYWQLRHMLDKLRPTPRPAVQYFCVYCTADTTPGFETQHEEWCPRYTKENL